MDYIYGSFNDAQIQETIKTMHDEIHRLLLHKDKRIVDEIFESDEAFEVYFNHLLCRYGSLNRLLNSPLKFVPFMENLEAAHHLCNQHPFNYKEYRRLILDSHSCLDDIFKEVGQCQV